MSGSLTLPHDISARLQVHAGQAALRDSGWLHLDPMRLHRAAVLVPLVCEKGQWHLLFTRRTNDLQDHSGQVSFPGGAWEEQDGDLEQTALREAWEEIGIDPASVAVLGKMARFDMVSYFQVTPVVGVVSWPCELNINSREVARAFIVPIDWLADPLNYQIKPRQFEDQTFQIPYYNDYDGEIIWGATAQITQEFLRLIQN
ncbi:MAG TPA: CoA pyrophosphatase [Anaerolineaceae bacterium]|nr:CoA pyrophosphatase [Anaerolineaceae bacterium]